MSIDTYVREPAEQIFLIPVIVVVVIVSRATAVTSTESAMFQTTARH